MQGFKKVLVALLVVMTILGTMGPVFAAPADVQGTKYEDAAVRLMALGIFKGDDKGNFNPDQPISRAEATAIVVRALGLEKSAEQMKGVTKFPDVNADPGLQWATGYINLGVSEGFIKGYPNGQFGGRDSVTYAQLAKMLLYAMKYGVTVEGGPWPNAVLAKADDLDLTKDITVAANAPIPRGDAAKMIDNALDVPTMEQVSWGTTQMWTPTGDTLIQKLGYNEIEGQVIEVAAVNNSLGENQLKVATQKKNGDPYEGRIEKYTLIEGFKPGDYFGLDVKVWVNDDDKAVFIEPVTKPEDVVYDRVKEVTKDADGDVTKVKLLVKDKTYQEHENGAYIYVNGVATDFAALDNVNAYGKFVVKDNRIAFADVYKFNYDGRYGAIVKSVDGETIKYITTSETVKTLRLDQAEGYTIYKNGKEIALSDVKADDVIYWYKNDDDDTYVMFVAGTKVEGTLEKAREKSVVIDGKSYDLSKDKTDGTTTVSSNDDDDVVVYSTGAQAVKDLGGKEVVALLDLNGYVRHIRGDAQATSTVRGVALNWWKTGSGYVQVLTSEGEKVTYEFDKISTYNDFEPNVDESAINVVKLTLNTDGKVKAFEVKTDADAVGVLELNKDGYILTDDGKYYVTDSTAFINADPDDLGDDDPEVVSWDSIKDAKDLSSVEAIVLPGTERDAKLVVFTAGFDEIKPASAEYALVTDAWISGDDTWVTLDTAGGEISDYKVASVADETYAEKGAAIVYRLNASGEVKVLAGYLKADMTAVEVDEIDGRYVTVGGAVYRVASDAVVYDATSSSGKLVKADFSDISVGDEIKFMVEYSEEDEAFVDDGQIKVILITKFGQ